jgi:CheY-like chemotaxis protein
LNHNWDRAQNSLLPGQNRRVMKKKTILLIEDDYLDVESVKRALKKLRIEADLHVAHNGAAGLQLLTGNSDAGSKVEPDIILLDINMPKMDGIEFLRIVRNYYSLSGIKIFVITTSSEEYDRMAAENLGVNGYILKPLDFKNGSSSDTLRLLEQLLADG